VTNHLKILDGLFGAHVNNLSQGLGKAASRQKLLTENLANVNTPGYKRKDMDFNVNLEEAGGRSAKLNEWQERRRQFMSDQTSNRNDGSNVDLEQEVYGMAETELRYQVLTDMTNRYFSGLKSVIREGR
jgi:flagellar basal-body rod protein FlgB